MVSPQNPADLDGVSSSADRARELADRTRELVDRLVRPSTADRDRRRHWDKTLFTALSAPTGPALAGLLVPEAHGGTGLTATQTCAVLDALGEGSRDPGLSLAVTVHAILATVPLRAFSTPAQRERYLPRMATGEWLGALSLRQTQGTAFTPTITARPATDGPGGWILDGEVDMVALGPQAHHFLLIAEHEDGSRTAFVIDRDTPRLRVNSTESIAMHTCPWGHLVLDGCFVPPETVLGTVGSAATEIEPLLATLDWVFSAASWLGIMRALTSDALAAAVTRKLFGAPLAHAQSARFALADIATRGELAAGLLHRAAAQFDAGGRPSRQDAATARLFVAASARTVTEGAARLVGPLAATGDQFIERAYRDALFFASTGGGNDVLRPVIAASLLGIG
ncbi:acyl-CoA dehydrogenase family protein [Streptomyces sp. NPDC058872]|uniref:acyl-CoA dehydrogenase family protein n=1 Tax=Streptomyces sp. NPDC058872 TaxID=3346661 RepID=UPI0036B440BD